MSFKIPLTKGFETVVDDIDSDLSQFKWYALESSGLVYARRDVNKKAVYLHQVILSRILGRALLDSDIPDHENRNGLDNTRKNIRLATQSNNMANQTLRKTSGTGYKGVHYDKRMNKFTASIKIKGKQKHLGTHDTAELAALAYNKAAIAEFGQFAHVNIVKLEG